MKIALTGASSVGKTFLSEHLMESAQIENTLISLSPQMQDQF